MIKIEDPSLERLTAIATEVGFPEKVIHNAMRIGVSCLLPDNMVRTVRHDGDREPYQDLPLFGTPDPVLSSKINADFNGRDRIRRKELIARTPWALNYYRQLVDSGRGHYPHGSDHYAAEAVVLGTIAAIAEGIARCDGEGAKESRDAVCEYYAATRTDQKALFLATGDNVFV